MYAYNSIIHYRMTIKSILEQHIFYFVNYFRYSYTNFNSNIKQQY